MQGCSVKVVLRRYQQDYDSTALVSKVAVTQDLFISVFYRALITFQHAKNKQKQGNTYTIVTTFYSSYLIIIYNYLIKNLVKYAVMRNA